MSLALNRFVCVLRTAGWQAVVHAGVMLIGYAVSVALAVHRVLAFERLQDAIAKGELGIEQLQPSLGRFGSASGWMSLYRFRRHVVFDLHVWSISGALLIAAAFLMFAAAAALPLRTAMDSPRDIPAPELPRIRAAWRKTTAAASAPLTGAAWLSLAFVAGLAGGVLAQAECAYACTTAEARRIAPSPPECVAGLFGVVDGLWLLLWAGVIPFLVVLVSARSRLRHDPEFLSQWCISCGYPRLPTGPGNPCTECGARPATPKTRLSVSKRSIVALSALGLALALGLHVATPHVPTVVNRMMRVAPMNSNVAVVPIGAAVMVTRPHEVIWLRIADSTGPGAPDLELCVMFSDQSVMSISQRHRNLRPWNPMTIGLPFPDGRFVRIWFDWQDGFKLAHVYLEPGDATSIRAVDPASFGSGLR